MSTQTLMQRLLSKSQGARNDGSIGAAFESLTNTLRSTGNDNFSSKNAAGLSAGLESYSEDAATITELEMGVQSLQTTLAGLEGYNNAQREAAAYAGMITGNIREFMSKKQAVGKDIIPSGADIGRIKPGLESYDEKENRAASIFTVTYNLRAARQDDFGEGFFPTVVVAPDQQGYHMHLNIINLINQVRRKSNGDEANWNRHNIVNVIRNPSLIDSSSTKLVPVYRDDTKDKFVDTALIANTTVDVNGEKITTSPLAINKDVELIAISQTDLQLEREYMDETDSVDTDILLKKIYIKVGEDVLAFPVSQVPTAQFAYPLQGDQQRMDVRFETEATFVGTKTLKQDGTPLVTLAPVVAANVTVYFRVLMNGSVIRDIGRTEMTANPIRLVKIIDSTNDVHTPDSAQFAAIVALFAGAQVIGYDLDARRTNLNRRSIGQMLETRQEVQMYAVPLLSPFTMKRPQGLNDTTDQSDLASLVTLTRAMASGKAVDTLLEATETIRAYTEQSRVSVGDQQYIFGLGSRLVTAHYEYQKVEIDKTVITRNSAELAANIQATLVNVIRDMVFRAYQTSGWKAAADMLEGGESKKPVVLAGTDQTLGRYLQITGDLRTLGGGFEQLEIVDTQNDKMKGKIILCFVPPGVAEGTPHPLQLGNMAWKPEVAVVLPIHRNGANSKELTVQPAFRHVMNLPILMEIDVVGIPESVETRIPTKVEGSITTAPVTP